MPKVSHVEQFGDALSRVAIAVVKHLRLAQPKSVIINVSADAAIGVDNFVRSLVEACPETTRVIALLDEGIDVARASSIARSVESGRRQACEAWPLCEGSAPVPPVSSMHDRLWAQLIADRRSQTGGSESLLETELHVRRSEIYQGYFQYAQRAARSEQVSACRGRMLRSSREY